MAHGRIDSPEPPPPPAPLNAVYLNGGCLVFIVAGVVLSLLAWWIP